MKLNLGQLKSWFLGVVTEIDLYCLGNSFVNI
jgi:hypothetical protein